MKSSQTHPQPVSAVQSVWLLTSLMLPHLQPSPCEVSASPIPPPFSSGMSRSRMNFRSGRRGPAAYLRRKERMLRISIRRMVKTDTFYLMVLTLVALNTICVAIVHHNQPDWLTIFLCRFCFWIILWFTASGASFLIVLFSCLQTMQSLFSWDCFWLKCF